MAKKPTGRPRGRPPLRRPDDARHPMNREAEGVDTGTGEHVGPVVTDERQVRQGEPEDWQTSAQRVMQQQFERARGGGAAPTEPPTDDEGKFIVQPSPAIGGEAERMVDLQLSGEGNPSVHTDERNTPRQTDQARAETEGRTPEDAEVQVARQPAEAQRRGIERWAEGRGGAGAHYEDDTEGRELEDADFEGDTARDSKVSIKPDQIAANVGRNAAEEPARLLRREEATDAEAVNPAARFNPSPGEGEPAPTGEVTDPGARHDPMAPWPAVNDPASSAPSASPEPGPEPSVQYNPSQDVEWSDPPGAVVGTRGPDAHDQTERYRQVADIGPSALDRKRVEDARAAREAGGSRAADPFVAGRAGRRTYTEIAQGFLDAYLDSVPDGEEPNFRHFDAALTQARRLCRGRGWYRNIARHVDERGRAFGSRRGPPLLGVAGGPQGQAEGGGGGEGEAGGGAEGPEQAAGGEAPSKPPAERVIADGKPV